MDILRNLRVEGAEALEFARDNECLVHLEWQQAATGMRVAVLNLEPDVAEALAADLLWPIVWIEGADA